MKINWKSPITYIVIAVALTAIYLVFTSQWFKNMFSPAKTPSNTNTGYQDPGDDYRIITNGVITSFPIVPSFPIIPVSPTPSFQGRGNDTNYTAARGHWDSGVKPMK